MLTRCATSRARLPRTGSASCDVRRQFVLPTRFHKRVNRAGFTRRVEGLFAATGLLRLFGSPVTIVAER